MHEQRQPQSVDVTEVTYGNFSLNEHCGEIQRGRKVPHEPSHD